jgi:hypothetical protein
MRIFIFKSEANRELGAFAHDPGGQQLPSKFGPWHAVGVIRPDKDPPHNLSRGSIEQGIASQGFQLYRKKAKKAVVAN